MLQWQTQSVMQDYSVSFFTAIDVVFMGETQGFSKCSGPCYPCTTSETKTAGEGRCRGFSPCGLNPSDGTISHLEKGISRGPGEVSHLCTLTSRRWDYYPTSDKGRNDLGSRDERLLAPFLLDEGNRWEVVVCVRGDISVQVCPLVSVCLKQY